MSKSKDCETVKEKMLKFYSL